MELGNLGPVLPYLDQPQIDLEFKQTFIWVCMFHMIKINSQNQTYENTIFYVLSLIIPPKKEKKQKDNGEHVL